MTEPKNLGRREFVKWSAAGVIAGRVAMPPLGMRRDERIRGANDRVVVALIGAGRQGQGNLGNAVKQPDTAVGAVCDVYEPNLAKGLEVAPGAKSYRDFRRVLENKDIDAVIIATPDHWHPIQTILACEAGKDVYVEKPISVTVTEGRAMVDAARRYKRIVQTGTQQRSGKHFQQAAELVKSGRIGKVTQVRTWNFGNESPAGIGNPPDSAPPKDLDWDMWLGPAPMRPFNANRFGVFPDRWSSFRWFWDYAGGMMTDWGVHWLDIVQLVMGVDAPHVRQRERRKVRARGQPRDPGHDPRDVPVPGIHLHVREPRHERRADQRQDQRNALPRHRRHTLRRPAGPRDHPGDAQVRRDDGRAHPGVQGRELESAPSRPHEGLHRVRAVAENADRRHRDRPPLDDDGAAREHRVSHGQPDRVGRRA